MRLKENWWLPERGRRTKQVKGIKRYKPRYIINKGTSLVAQWLRIRLPMQGSPV